MGFCTDKAAAIRPGLPVPLYLIAVCDTMLSDEKVGAIIRDSGVCKIQKAGFLGPWLIGYCGLPEFFLPFKVKMGKQLGPLAGNPDLTEDELINVLVDGYSAYREEKIVEQVLAKWHINSLAEFQETQHTLPKLYENLWPFVDRFDLDITLCVAGFNKTAGSQLRIIENPGTISENLAHVNPGVVTIGSGAPHAASHLRAWFDKSGSLKEAIYYLLEAKMVADMDVTSVGAETDVVIVEYHMIPAEPSVSSYLIRRERIKEFRAAWEAERRNPSKSILKLLELEPLYNF